MKCKACQQFITESTVIANVEYFTCGLCGGCAEIDFNPKSLSFDVLFHKNSENTYESYSSKFIIDGIDLLKLVTKSDDIHSNFIGCFARGWSQLNEHSKKQLLLIDAPEWIADDV
jgi:hypothetical protein